MVDSGVGLLYAVVLVAGGGPVHSQWLPEIT